MRSRLFLCLLLAPIFALEAQEFDLRGRVVDRDGQGLPDARVEALPEGRAVTTDENGEFLLEDLEPPVTLAVSHFSHRQELIDLPSVPEEPLVVTLEPGPIVREQMMVYAERLGERYSPRSVASSPVQPIELAAPPASLAEIAVQVPGVSENGQGGLFQVVSVRGISRQRILNLVAGSRMTSERRAGTSTSWIDAELMEEVDVVRGPASTYYGSGALGGAIELYPRRFDRLSVRLGYRDQGDHHNETVAWGNGRLSLAIAHRKTGDTEAADGSERFDRYDQWSGSFRADWGQGRYDQRLLVVPGYTEDIGKPNTDWPERATIYPEERHLLTRYSISKGESWRAAAFVHPHELTTRVDEGVATEIVDNETFDLGALFEAAPFRSSNRNLDGRVGVDYFGRRGVDAVERSFVNDTLVETVRPLDDARQDELAAYSVVNGRWSRFSAEAGARLTWIDQQNANLPSEDETAVSGFVGMGADLGSGIQLTASLGTGLRVPSLSELFFTGTTGRGQVIGNPSLDSERAWNGEVGMRWASRRTFLGFNVFRNEIDDYIERIRVDADTRTFVNLTSGTIEGVELDGFYQPGSDWRIDWGGHWIEGESDDGSALADIPPAQLSLGGRWNPEPWELESRLRWRSDKDPEDVGPSEQPIPSAWLLDLSLAYRLRPDLRLALWTSNLLDEEYFPSADDQAVLATGRTIGVSFSWQAR